MSGKLHFAVSRASLIFFKRFSQAVSRQYIGDIYTQHRALGHTQQHQCKKKRKNPLEIAETKTNKCKKQLTTKTDHVKPSDYINEPPHEKNNILVSDLVDCTATEDG